MMNRKSLTTLLTALTLAAGVLAAADSASAQCRRGGIFCAQVQVGISGGIVIGAPPPPPMVIYQPAPPPPPVVVYEPAPPPVVVYQQRPVAVGVVPAPMVLNERRSLGWGLHGHIGGMMSERVQMGGATGAFRLRPNDHFALDFGIGTYAGIDYNDNDRVEVPLTVDGLFFLNGRGVWQPYALVGVGVSFAQVSTVTDTGTFRTSDPVGYVYYGGELGVGVELRLNQHWALSGDVRGFIRQRASDGTDPEYTDAATGRQTDTSWGALGTLGATLYF